MKNNNKSSKAKAFFITALALFLVGAFASTMTVLSFLSKKDSSSAEAKNSVIFIYTEWTDAFGNQTGVFGSGFFIGETGKDPEYIVTNAHVIQDAYNNNGTILAVYSGATNDTVVPRVVHINSAKDHAILKLPEPTNKRVPLSMRRVDDVNEGETVYALGYPGVSTGASSYAPKDIKDISMTRGIISKKTFLAWADIQAYEMDVAIHGGNSGGPLVDEKGRAVGINTFGLENTEQMNFAIIVDEILLTLRTLEIPHTLTSNNDINIAAFIWLAAAVLLLAGCAVMLILYSKQKKKAPAGAAVSPNNAGGAFVGAKTPVMRGVSGKYAGARFEFKNERINIGRDAARCNLVYDSTVAGISAYHCSVYYDKQAQHFVLEDAGSTYGTFIGQGQKITPNVPTNLHAGDSFYLADKTNRFVLGLE